jgi:hypothetical protein
MMDYLKLLKGVTMKGLKELDLNLSHSSTATRVINEVAVGISVMANMLGK